MYEKFFKAGCMITLMAVFFWLPVLMAGEHGGQEHAGEEHGAHEHGGEALSGHDHGAHGHDRDKKSSMKELASIDADPVVDAEGGIHLNNKICPVTGEEVSGKHSVLAKGVVYNTCCKQCVGKIKKNPEKYSYSQEELQEFMHSHEGHEHGA